MEYRYYIITTISVIALQFLLFCFSKTATWLGDLSNRSRKIVTFSIYIVANLLMILHVTRILPNFRLIALILTLLLFIFFISFCFWGIYTVGKQIFSPNSLNRWLKISYIPVLFGLIGLTIYNAYSTKVVHYQVTLDKPIQPLKIGVASDFHLGKFFGGKQLDKLATIFNQEQVDLILLPGDIMDDNVEAYLAENMQPHLAKLKAPLGVYATMGNHDLFGAEAEIYQEITKAGITVLWDQAVTLDGKFTIIGRNDELVKNRPETAELLALVDKNLPVFLMDHRPTQIEQHAQLPIDIQVSGHTHNGQIFPANIITHFIYRLAHGYEKIGNGHFFVTSGYGFWGIPMRLGSQSEVMIIEVKGK